MVQKKYGGERQKGLENFDRRTPDFITNGGSKMDDHEPAGMAGILTWEHYKRLGAAWMVFLWLTQQQRQAVCETAGAGVVCNGEPISYPQISAALGGMPIRTIERHVALLELEGYIISKQVGGKGKTYWIADGKGKTYWIVEQPARSGGATRKRRAVQQPAA